MGWREEIAAALDEWIKTEGGTGKAPRWHCLGRAVRTAGPGGYAVDVRGVELGPDQLDALRLAGPDPKDVEKAGFSVSDVTQDGSLLTARVAEFAELPDPYLWLLKQPPTFLVEALRDGIAALGEAPLAAALAAGRIGGASATAPAPPGFHPAQADAYRACLGTGVRLVWGPPGTGKTTVLRRAIGELIGRGERVLLVSATNIAVDNALLGVVKERRHARGDLVRVGPPQLRELADDPDVALPLLVRERLAEAAARSRDIERDLVAIRDRAEQLAELDTALTGFDAAAYVAAVQLLRTPGEDPESARAHADAARTRQKSVARIQQLALAEVEEARREAAQTERWERVWGDVDELLQERARLRLAAERREAEALLTADHFRELREELRQLDEKGTVARWRARERRAQLQGRVDQAEERAARESDDAASARTTAEARIGQIDTQLGELTSAIPYTREQIRTLKDQLASAEAGAGIAREELHVCHNEVEHCEQAALRAEEAVTLTGRAERNGWPHYHAEAEQLRPRVAEDAAQRTGLEQRYEQAQKEYERLARNAQTEIVKGARLVATTLARFRTNKAVFEGPYDVVLLDEASAATLPEALLAAAKAGRAAVLLGDFMQLGAVIPAELKKLERPDVQRWLLPDVFQHCGITGPDEAQRHPACVTLVQQHRFGPAVMRLANDLAYGGVLQGADRPPPAQPGDDPEIVIVDTDGLHELAVPRLTGKRKGWWPAGTLIARAIADLHHDGDEATGVVTPYGVQAAATLEALRDVEGGGQLLADVGTAHRFQGREFPVVVFDTVESAAGRALWMGCAHPEAGQWEREGVRLFNVAVTRVQTRLYVIASGRRLEHAPPGTALAQLHALVGTPGVRVLHARHLVTPPTEHGPHMGRFGQELADVLGRHVRVDEIVGEEGFFPGFEREIRNAHTSLWIWAPWVAQRVRSLLPELEAAVARGVRVTVFIRDDTDEMQRKPPNQKLINDLRAVVTTVVPINMMHQKIVVIDERTVLLGSLNPLSQRWTREVMLTMRGAHFARTLLEHEHAEDFARPPKCGRCGGDEIEIRRHKDHTWHWRCYAPACKTTASGRSNAWKQPIRLRRPR